EQATLRAPVAGQVQRVLYNTSGAVVPPGQEILEIVPRDDLLVFETRIDPKDIGFIRPNQPATVRVTAYDYTVFGALEGRVQSISADSLSDEKGNPFYAVKVIVDKTSSRNALELIPGMLAEVSIRTEDRSVLSYLTKPLRRGLSEAMTER
ncbi:MAG: HlyD family efflux transporter periplasmic adaptor subunit, partial [Limnobacter sp.]|nr:HlyD family efflux transporter periplasmic adaptor subunit [Limnobacter sp.]